MDCSIYMDKSLIPSFNDLKEPLGDTYILWDELREYVLSSYPDAFEEWNFPGKKYGWSFRMKDKKRAIIYFLPRSGYFKVAFVFGQKAYDDIMLSDVAPFIITELQNAKKYAEGRGIRIDVKDESILEDIKKLVKTKLKY